MTETCAISAIVPVHNGERHLAESLESILAQTRPADEVIVVDDGSTDGSADVARKFAPAVSVRTQSHQGAAAARNAGVESSRGACVAFLDGGDLWMPDKLARQMAALEKDPALDMVLGQMEQFLSPELDASHRQKILGHGVITPGYTAGAMLIRRASFLRAGPFPAQWRVEEYIDWYVHADEVGLKGLMLEGVVLRRRLHGHNIALAERDARRLIDAAIALRGKQEKGRGA